MSKAEKLLARMRQTKAGWKPQDFSTMYLGFGFTETEGKKHRKYQHPAHPDLWTTVSRGDPLSKSYAEDAVALIEELQQREEEAHGPDR